MRSKQKIQENLFRSLIQKEISRIIRENEQIPDEEAPVDQEAPQEEEPEIDRSQVLEKITYNFTKALKNNLQQLSSDELADSVDSIMNHFGLGKDSKMQILRTIKNKIQL